MSKTPVVLLRKYAVYNAGERAGFEGRELDGLLERGDAKLLNRPSGAEPAVTADAAPAVRKAAPAKKAPARKTTAKRRGRPRKRK